MHTIFLVCKILRIWYQNALMAWKRSINPKPILICKYLLAIFVNKSQPLNNVGFNQLDVYPIDTQLFS